MPHIDHVPPGIGKLTSTENCELLAELTHRTNNEYASIVGAISLRAAKSNSEDVKTAMADVAEILMRFADVQRVLMPPQAAGMMEVSGYLRSLCRLISRARLEHHNIKLLFVEAGTQFLPAESCWKLGLSVSELITNAAKHGLRRDGKGVIRVELTTDADFVKCIVSNNESRPCESKPGRGLKLVQSLVQSTGGTFDYAFDTSCGTMIISIPNRNATVDRRERAGDTITGRRTMESAVV